MASRHYADFVWFYLMLWSETKAKRVYSRFLFLEQITCSDNRQVRGTCQRNYQRRRSQPPWSFHDLVTRCVSRIINFLISFALKKKSNRFLLYSESSSDNLRRFSASVHGADDRSTDRSIRESFLWLFVPSNVRRNNVTLEYITRL